MNLQNRSSDAYKLFHKGDGKMPAALAFLLGVLAFALLLPSANKAQLTELLTASRSSGAIILSGCVFLPVCVYISSLSLAGSLVIQLLNVLCGAFLTALSGAIIPGLTESKNALLSVLTAAATFAYVTVFILISDRSYSLSREIAGRLSPDKRFRGHFISLTAIFIASATLILLVFLLLSGFYEGIIL